VEVNTQSQPDVAVNTLIVINVLVIFVVQSMDVTFDAWIGLDGCKLLNIVIFEV